MVSTGRGPLFRVISDAGVLAYFFSANSAASHLDNATLDGVRLRDSGRCWAESWGLAPYYDGPWIKMDPQPRYDAWKKDRLERYARHQDESNG